MLCSVFSGYTTRVEKRRGMVSTLSAILLAGTASGVAEEERPTGSAQPGLSRPGLSRPGQSRPGQSRPGHQKMLTVLEAIRQASPKQNVYVGDANARQLRRQVARASNLIPQEQAQLRLNLGNAELRLGKEHEAISQLQRALALLPAADTTDLPLALEIRFRLGVAYLRLGETENCAARKSAESCILPIQGAAIHTHLEGSNEAIKHFSYVLQHTQEDSAAYLRSQWLLNLASMTLGEYPDGVHARYRIPADNFRSDEPFPRFVNVAAKLGLDTFSLAGGAIAEDFDGDLDLDLVVSSSDPEERLRFFRNNGSGGFDEDGDGLEGLFGGLNMVHADYDNDGDADVLVLRGGWMFQAGEQPNSLLQNQGDGSFVDVTFAAGLGEVHYPTQTAAWADYDNDGDLDLYVGNESYPGVEFPGQLFNNRGDGTFEDVARSAGVDQVAMTKAVVWGDYNGDRFPDLYISNYGKVPIGCTATNATARSRTWRPRWRWTAPRKAFLPGSGITTTTAAWTSSCLPTSPRQPTWPPPTVIAYCKPTRCHASTVAAATAAAAHSPTCPPTCAAPAHRWAATSVTSTATASSTFT